MSADETQYAFGEVPVSARVSSEASATPDELVKIANGIWRQIKKSNIDANNEPENDALLERLQTEHKAFATSFPIALRWMVQLRSYKANAFRRYLLKHAAATLKTREDFLRLQAEYLVCLFQENSKNHPSPKQVGEYREGIVKQLLAEDELYREMVEEVDADIQRLSKENDAERRAALYKLALEERVRRERAAQSTTSADDD
jgi:hypothetical protein